MPARSLLLAGRSLAHVAELRGFCDVCHFSREFARSTGVATSPWSQPATGVNENEDVCLRWRGIAEEPAVTAWSPGAW